MVLFNWILSMGFIYSICASFVASSLMQLVSHLSLQHSNFLSCVTFRTVNAVSRNLLPSKAIWAEIIGACSLGTLDMRTWQSNVLTVVHIWPHLPRMCNIVSFMQKKDMKWTVRWGVVVRNMAYILPSPHISLEATVASDFGSHW